MQKISVKEIVLSSLFIALGVVFPVAFHSFGSGTIFLPMHIPVLIAGFVLSIPFAILVGALTPLLSSMLTGMPPVFPILPFMIFELATYGGVSSLLYKKFRLNVFISLIGSMIAGRIVSTIVVWLLVTLFMAKLPSPIVFITGAVTEAIPGIIIQLAFIPGIVYALSKSNYILQEGVN